MQIQVSPDESEAYVVGVSRDFGGGREVTAWDLKAALGNRGIVEGIREEALQSLAETLSRGEEYSGRPILVACGKPPGPGRDGKLVFFPPKKVDVRKQKLTWLIFPGEKVATIAPPSPGEPGVTVRGDKIPGKLGNEAKAALHAGVEFGKNGKDIVANIAGFVRIDGKSISVESRVTVSKDKMTAQLNVIAPKKVIGNPGVEDYCKLLGASGVVYGVSKKSIEKALKRAHDKNDDRNGVIVAKGTEPKRGEDAKIEYKFSLDIKPGLLLPDGTMDYRERSLIKNVAAEEGLAVKTPATLGTPGMTVTGEPIPAKPGKDVPLKALENVALSEDRLKLIAKREGMAVLDKSGGVRVVTEFVVRGDVDYSTGNVRSKGTLKIEGSVLAKFSVESRQDVLIDDGVDSANVYAGGDLFVRRGIQGSPDTEIIVGGEIRAFFIESAAIRAKGDIVLGQSLRHSDVRTTGAVKVTEKKGTIVGGKILATRGILANEVGSELGTRTELIAGIDASTQAALEALEEKIHEYEANLRRLDVQLGPAVEESKKTQFHTGKKSWLTKMLSDRAQIVTEREKVMQERNRLAAEMRSDLSAKVRILGKVHSGVVVRIGEATYSIGNPVQNVTFSYNDENREVECIKEG